MSDSSGPSIALIHFKKQIDALTESLHYFNPLERIKAVEILQECIRGLERRNSYPLSEELPDEVLNAIEGITEDRQNDIVFCIPSTEMCQGNNFIVVETGSYEEVQNAMSDASRKDNQYQMAERKHEVIQDDRKFLPTNEEDLPEEVLDAIDGMTKDRQNGDVFCLPSEDLCQRNNLAVVERGAFEVVQRVMSDTSHGVNEYSLPQGCCGKMNSPPQPIPTEEPEFMHSDEESFPEEVLKAIDRVTEGGQNDVFCVPQQNMCPDTCLPVVRADVCPDSNSYEGAQSLVAGRHKENHFSLSEDCDEDLSSSNDEIGEEGRKYLEREKNLPEEIIKTINEVAEEVQAEAKYRMHRECARDEFHEDKKLLAVELSSDLDSGSNDKDRNSSPDSDKNDMDRSPSNESNEDLNTPEDTMNEDFSFLQTDDDCESPHSRGEWKSALKCPKCEEEYDSKRAFLDHVQEHTGKSKSCPDCLESFQNSTAFKLHKQLDMCVRLGKVYKCKMCNKKLYGGSQYKTHLSAHKRNQCKTCGDHFARKKQLEAHTANVHSSSLNKNAFKCHLCERSFAQKRSLVYHFNITHPSTDLICAVCLEMFSSSSELESHQAIHKQLMFKCEKCNEQFSRRQQYTVHMNEHEKYKCTTCSDSFAAKKAAVKHARLGHQVTGLTTVQLQCAECGEMFTSRAQLNSHMAEHSGGKPVGCEKCKITFKHERNYKIHLESLEHLKDQVPDRQFVCKECKKSFSNKNNLRVHISRMHKPNMTEQTCMHCSYKTTSQTNFKRHLALHTEKPQFICEKCGVKFLLKNALIEHDQRLHCDSKDFSCYKCGKLFGRSSGLNRHMLNTHSETALYTCHCKNSYKTLSNLKRHQLLTHGHAETKPKRLEKLFPEETCEQPKKKIKKEKTTTTETKVTPAIKNEVHSLNSQISARLPESDSVVTMAEQESHQQDMVRVSYNMNFTEQDKSQVVYSHNGDIGELHVVESLIHLDGDLAKQGASVLINVRNLFGRPLTNEYIMSPSIESSLVNSLGDMTPHIGVSGDKQDVISELQDYIIPHDLHFLNV